MTEVTLASAAAQHPSADRPRSRGDWMKLLPAAALALFGAWSGGVSGIVAVAAATALGAWALGIGPRRSRKPSAVGDARIGSEVMIARIVPDWARHVTMTSDTVGKNLGALLENFSHMSTTLDDLAAGLVGFGIDVDPGAIGAAIGSQGNALEALTAASARAFAERDAAVAELGRCAESLQRLRNTAKMARAVAKHTRLIAFNATIEANRNGRADAGAAAVAEETKMLAGRMAEVGNQIDSLVTELTHSVSRAHRDAAIADTSPDELRLEVEQHARSALALMFGTATAAARGASALRESGDRLRVQLDEAFVQFQFGDRVAQMLSIVAQNMQDFAQWTAQHPHASQSDAAEWLTALEASYTMDEQRSQHHANVHIDRGSEVEFF